MLEEPSAVILPAGICEGGSGLWVAPLHYSDSCPFQEVNRSGLRMCKGGHVTKERSCRKIPHVTELEPGELHAGESKAT